VCCFIVQSVVCIIVWYVVLFVVSYLLHRCGTFPLIIKLSYNCTPHSPSSIYLPQVRGRRPKLSNSFASIGVDSLGAVMFIKYLSDSLNGLRLEPAKIYAPGITIKYVRSACTVLVHTQNLLLSAFSIRSQYMQRTCTHCMYSTFTIHRHSPLPPPPLLISPLLSSFLFRSFAADLYKRLLVENPAALTKLGERREEWRGGEGRRDGMCVLYN
jgi:hypothetical protein